MFKYINFAITQFAAVNLITLHSTLTRRLIRAHLKKRELQILTFLS